MPVTGPIILANRTARRQFLLHGEVVSFRTADRTTGTTWWRESRTGEKRGDAVVDQIGTVEAAPGDLKEYVDKSGFRSVDAWLDAIDDIHGDVTEGYLYRITGIEDNCAKCGDVKILVERGFCSGCLSEEAHALRRSRGPRTPLG